jgi:mannosyltransferase OCH1-like enzyme
MIYDIKPRTDIPIKNRYELVYDRTNIDRYAIAINYIDSETCYIFVKKIIGLNNTINIAVRIYDDSEKNVCLININENTIYTVSIVKLFPLIMNDQYIPKIIMQTAETNNFVNENHKNALLTWINLNPEYEYVFYNSVDRRKFIKNNFNETIINAYDSLILNIYRIDLFKYCWLYINGGCYSDYKSYLLKPLRIIIKPTDKYVLCTDTIGVLNSFIIIEKKHDKMFELINHMAWLINEKLPKKMIVSQFTLNGSIIFGNFFANYNNYNHILTSINDKVMLNNKTFIIKCHRDYYKSKFGIIQKYNLNTLHYNILIYQNREKINNYIILVYKHNTSNHFVFEIINLNGETRLKIFNLKNMSWDIDLKLKIIDDISNREYHINVGKSPAPVTEIPFYLESTSTGNVQVNGT